MSHPLSLVEHVLEGLEELFGVVITKHPGACYARNMLAGFGWVLEHPHDHRDRWCFLAPAMFAGAFASLSLLDCIFHATIVSYHVPCVKLSESPRLAPTCGQGLSRRAAELTGLRR